jgi:hypothetical protein
LVDSADLDLNGLIYLNGGAVDAGRALWKTSESRQKPMKLMKPTLLRLLLVGIAILSLSRVSGQTTAFTYQGRLHDNGLGAAGNYDLRFSLYDAQQGGASVAIPQTNSAAFVTNGLFTAVLDFGDIVFGGANRWLEIAVRTNGGADFTVLSPRQPISPSPYSIYAARSGMSALATNSLSLGGATASSYAQTSGASLTNVTIVSGSGAGLTNVPTDYLQPSTYGAVGDGATDDTLALANALNAASAKRGRVNLMGKTYRISSTLAIPGEDVELYNGAIVTRNHIVAVWAQGDRDWLHDLYVGGPGTDYRAGDTGILMTSSTTNYVQQQRLDRVFVTNFWCDIHTSAEVQGRMESIVADASYQYCIWLENSDETSLENFTCCCPMQTEDLAHSGTGTWESLNNCVGVFIFHSFSALVANGDINFVRSAIIADGGGLQYNIHNIHSESLYGSTNWPVMAFTNCGVTLSGLTLMPLLPGVVQNGQSPVNRVGLLFDHCDSGNVNIAAGNYQNCFPVVWVQNSLGLTPFPNGGFQGSAIYYDGTTSWPFYLAPYNTYAFTPQTIYQRSGYAPNQTIQTLRSGAWRGALQWGADSADNSLTPNTTKSFSISVPSYTGSSYDIDLLRWDGGGVGKAFLGTCEDSYAGPNQWEIWCSTGSAASSNCFHIAPTGATSLVPFSAPVITNNGLVWLAGISNNIAANGSIMTDTNGNFYVRSNDTWVRK